MLLTTKLFMPPMPLKTLRREALLDLLADGLSPEKRLVLVCAPAGYGKTTLVCGWLQGVPGVCWYSLEESDNDPNLFFAYLIASVQKQFPKIVEQAQGFLHGPQPAAQPVVLSALLNDLAQSDAQIVIVLDDYQVIHTRLIHEGLSFLLDHLPENVHLVITTRSDPALPLNRYRSRGHMLEIRSEALRFSANETSDFMQDIAGLSLDAGEIAILENCTEGWIAGLHMAALSLRGKKDATQFIHSLSGTNRYILDYLVEEVLNNQPESIQLFLTQTSILNRFCASLCAAVLENEENACQDILIRLEQANLFLNPLDEGREWYRYHHLFRDLLTVRLKQSTAQQIRELHRRAAGWYEANGLASEAIQHYISAEAFARAADLVEQHTLGLFAQGELNQLVAWIKKLPAGLATRRPWLCIYQAWALAFAGKNSDADALMALAVQALSESNPALEVPKIIEGEINALRGFMAITGGDLQKALELVALPEPESLFARSTVYWARGYAWRMQGRLAEAEKAFRKMLEVGQQMNNLWTTSTALVELGAVLRLLGRMEDAGAIFRAGLDAMQQVGSGGLGFAGRLEAFLASILYEQNQLEEARRLAGESVAHNALWGNPNHVAYGHWIQARVLLGSGDFEAAEEALRQAELAIAQPAVIPTLKASIQGQRVRLWLAGGQLAEAERWDTDQPLTQSSAGLNIEMSETQILIHARIWMAQGNSPRAYQFLENLETSARAGDRNNTLIEALTLKSLAAPNQAAALDALNSSLKLGIPKGYRRVYLDEGKALKPLLESLRGRSELVEPLLKPAARKSLVLTGREMEILHGMADGLSNKQIGARLYISAGTVKAHSAAIYRKLDAVNRTEAIAKAKDLGLL